MSSFSSRVAKKLQGFGQVHVLKYLDELSEAEASALLTQVDAVDLDLVRQAHAYATLPPTLEDKIVPLVASSVFTTQSTNNNPQQSLEWKSKGLFEICKGRVGAILLAGGQGTRLGFAGPKGSFNPQLNSNKTLFQLSIERLKKIKSMAGNSVGLVTPPTFPLYIMTSESNDVETRQFFEQNQYFGLDRAEIFFFTQGMLPCVTAQEGKLMLETKSSLAMSPDGNGGLYSALDKSGALADMTRRGVEFLHVMAIDNPQNLPGDPTFVGLCVANKVEAGNLCIAKQHAAERVGVCALRNNTFHVVEYTETHGEDVSNLANICNHFFTVKFIMDKVLPGMKALHHAAHKTIPTVEDSKSKGIKLELFIFDAFPFASQYLALEAQRLENFAPIKNAEGEDSPETCRKALSILHRSWLERAGAVLVGEGMCEVSALVSIDGQGLDKLVSGMRMQLPLLLESSVPGVCVDIDRFGSDELRVQVDLLGGDNAGITVYRVVNKRSNATQKQSDQSLRNKLASIDISATTPMDALFLLNELKQLE